MEEATARSTLQAEPAVVLRSVSKRYQRELRAGRRFGLRAIGAELGLRSPIGGSAPTSEVVALDDVSLEIAQGDALGVIGFNGAGKSTLLRLIAGLTKPTTGEIDRPRSIGALLDPTAGFDPVLTGRENAEVTYTVCAGKTPGDRLVDDILDYAGVGHAAEHPVRTYSQGMKVRLGFSVMVHLDPDLLVIDEALAVGDVAFQLQCFDYLHSYCRAGGTLVFASHSMWAFQHIATRGLLLDEGRIACEGTSEDVADVYLRAVRARSGDGGAGEIDLLDREQVIRRSTGPGASDAVDNDSGGSSREARSTATTSTATTSRQTRPVRFSAVDISGSDGGPVVPGGPLDLAFHLESTEPFGSATLGFMVWTADLTLGVFANLSHDVVGADVDGFELAAGQRTVRCRVASVPLEPGSFAVRAAVYDGLTGDLLGMTGFEDTPWWFEVEHVETGDVSLQGALRPVRSVESEPFE